MLRNVTITPTQTRKRFEVSDNGRVSIRNGSIILSQFLVNGRNPVDTVNEECRSMMFTPFKKAKPNIDQTLKHLFCEVGQFYGDKEIVSRTPEMILIDGNAVLFILIITAN